MRRGASIGLGIVLLLCGAVYLLKFVVPLFANRFAGLGIPVPSIIRLLQIPLAVITILVGIFLLRRANAP
jgi:hypothetical protein